MTMDSLIPQEWAARLLENLNDAHVYAKVVNRDFEGQIKRVGDSVRINTIGRIDIGTYTKNSTTLSRQNPQAASQVLTITEAKYFDFEIDDIDAAQQKPKVMDAYMKEAAWGLSDTCDAYLATTLTNGVAAANQLTAATSVGVGASDDDAYELIVDLGVKLDENNAPRTDRWVVIPPWYNGVLKKHPNFVGFGTDASRATIRGTAVGEIDQMQIYVSNNVPVNGSAYDIIAGSKHAATFAEQLGPNSPEAYRPEGAFSDAMKGLHLYGAKVTRPDCLAKVAATQAT